MYIYTKEQASGCYSAPFIRGQVTKRAKYISEKQTSKSVCEAGMVVWEAGVRQMYRHYYTILCIESARQNKKSNSRYEVHAVLISLIRVRREAYFVYDRSHR